MSLAMTQRKTLQWKRKLLHLFNGSLGFSLYNFSGLSEMIVIGVLTVFFLASFSVDIYRMTHPSFDDQFCTTFGEVIRESEKGHISSMTKGMFAFIPVLLLFPPQVDLLIVPFFTLGDPAGAIAGFYLGKHKYKKHKSVEGSLAVWVVCSLATFLVVTFLFPPLGWSGLKTFSFVALAGLIGAVAEGLFSRFDDNLTVPFIGAPCLWVLCKVYAVI